jgi:hypothetical protein
VPASSRLISDATNFSSGETLAAAAAFAERLERDRDREVTSTGAQTQDRKQQSGQLQGPAAALTETNAPRRLNASGGLGGAALT